MFLFRVQLVEDEIFESSKREKNDNQLQRTKGIIIKHSSSKPKDSSKHMGVRGGGGGGGGG